MHNGIMIQGFEWHLPDDGTLYDRIAAEAELFKANGVTAVWLPPACKGTWSGDVGYGVYDLYDLGEFDQKGTVRTKYGTREQLLRCIEALHAQDIQVYADVVLNHKAGADYAETCVGIPIDPNNRKEQVGEEREIEAWTGFNFPGRAGKYSDFEWHWFHFTGVDYDERTGEKGLFRIKGDGKYWAQDVSQEKGNYDYLMFSDIDHAHPEVQEELAAWADWFIETTGVDGFRMDAAKHISAGFMKDFFYHVRQTHDRDFFFVAEYWDPSLQTLDNYLSSTGEQPMLFDVQLHFNFHFASVSGSDYDLRTILDNTLVSESPTQAVTFVENHDSQPGQSLASPVEDWFKPLAYAIILLRSSGYPCVFYGDYYGSGDGSIKPQRDILDKMMNLREEFAYGSEDDYLEQADAIGWVRHGKTEEMSSLAIVMTNREAATMRMFVGKGEAGFQYADYLGNSLEKVTIDEEGYGEFPVEEASVSCWLRDGMPLFQ